MLEILTRITEGNGQPGDVELLEELCYGIKDGALCGLGQTAPNPVLTTIKYFRNEYDAHINDKKCPAGECSSLIEYSIERISARAVLFVQGIALSALFPARLSRLIQLI